MTLRTAGLPSPLATGTADDADLPPPIPFDHEAETRPELPPLDVFAVGEAAPMPGWLTSLTRMIRPLCVGALMAIPTVGAATVGSVAIIDHAAAMHAVEASTAFLAGIPSEIVLLIGALATGYSLSKTVERLRGARV